MLSFEWYPRGFHSSTCAFRCFLLCWRVVHVVSQVGTSEKRLLLDAAWLEKRTIAEYHVFRAVEKMTRPTVTGVLGNTKQFLSNCATGVNMIRTHHSRVFSCQVTSFLWNDDVQKEATERDVPGSGERNVQECDLQCPDNCRLTWKEVNGYETWLD